MRKFNQAMVMHEFNDTYREHFEPELFKRNNEEMVESIHQVLQSCERDKYFTLKLLSFRAIYNYEEIYNTLRAHEESRRKKNSKIQNSYDFINIKDTDMILIKVEWLIRHNGIERQEIDGKTVEVVNPEEVMEVLIAIPRFVKKYYFRLSGNYYTTTFQIVDGSTYNNSTATQSKVDTVTMKMMFGPLVVFRSFYEMMDIETGEIISAIQYNSIIFNNIVNAMYYLFAHFGFYGICRFLDIDCVFIGSEPIINDDYYNFEKNGIYISCNKVPFQDPMVQSLVSTIHCAINKNTTLQDLFNIRYWLKNLGTAFKNSTIDKGLFILDSVDGLFDNITKRDLHLPEEDKENVYTIIRWILREFSNLRVKENVDIRTKRIRIADYIGAVYATKINKGLHRISDMGRRVTLAKVKQAIYSQPLYILNNISSPKMSNLVSYRDLVNDNDAMTALKWTFKGISGLGEDGSSVQPIYRHVDPSHVGILDLDASSSSDPGMSGMICPMKKIYNHSFSEYQEPNEWRQNWEPVKQEYFSNVENAITFDHQLPPKEYYKIRDQIVQEELEINRITCPVYNINDPNISYTYSNRIEAKKNDEPIKSLFTIRDDEEDDI